LRTWRARFKPIGAKIGNLGGFKTEAEANLWIVTKSAASLKERESSK